MEHKTCPICAGVTVAASKEVRDSWKKRFFDAHEKADRGTIPVAEFEQVKRDIDVEMEAYRDCQFCNGQGTVSVTDRDKRKSET